MLENKDRLLIYFDSLINSIFKILPLYEEENVGVEVYVESLLFELYGLDAVIDMEKSYEYTSLLSTLESLKEEVVKEDSEQKVIKREVFKCISVVKNMIVKIEKGE